MGFSSKLKADYIELINKELDSLPIINVNDFKTISEELNKILQYSNNKEGIIFIPVYKDWLDSIFIYLSQPELFVQSANDFAEFRQIIIDRIQAKIIEFQNYTEAQKELYIKSQTSIKDIAVRNQQSISEYQSKRESHSQHLQTEHEMLLEMQEEFQQEMVPQQTEAAVPNTVELVGNFHIIGELYFLIELNDIGLANEIYTLLAVNNNQRLGSIRLQQEDIELVRNNIENVNELKNIFSTIIRGSSANQILNIILSAESEVQGNSNGFLNRNLFFGQHVLDENEDQQDDILPVISPQ